MTVAVSNTNLTDSFNSWRLNTNLAATVISNNAVTVFRAGSSARGKAVTGNTHVKGTVSALELRTTTIKGGNAGMGTAGFHGNIEIASNTSITGNTFTVSANTTFSSNVLFNTSGGDTVNLSQIGRVRISGGTQGQFLRIATNATTPAFKSLTLRDITDLSSNSAHIILSGANTTFSAGAKDSPHLIFAGGSNNGVDKFHMFAGDNTTAGDDDLIIQLTDNVGDSNININNAANTNMATISSRGLISANGAAYVGNVTHVDNVISYWGTSNDLAITHDGNNSLITDTGTGDLVLRASNDIFLTNVAGNANYARFNEGGAATLYYNNSIKLNTKADGVDITGELQSDSLDVDGAADISGTATLGAVTVTGATILNGATAVNGNITLGNASTDTITTKGTFANAAFSGAATFNGNVIIGNASGDDLTVKSTTTFEGGVNIASGSAIAAPTGTFATLVATGTTNLNGNVNLGNTLSDVITVQGLTTVGDISLTAPAKIKLSTGNTIVGKNGKLHANNAITNSTIKGVMLENSGVTAATYGSASAFPVVTVDAQGLVTGVTTSALNNATASVKGIASFATANFTVASGAVSSKDITLTSDSGSAAATIGETFTVSGGEGIDTSATGTTLTIASEIATASNKGVASFSTDNFLVSSGVVTVKNNGIILGTETTGNYIATIAGTANEIAVSGSGSETAGVTLSLPDDVTIGQDLTVGRHLIMGDSDIIKLGAGSDLHIYHDGSNSYVHDGGTGSLSIRGTDLYLRNAANEVYVGCASDGQVYLRYDNVTKFSTTATGATITGTAVATGLDINGSADISGTLTVGNVTVTGTLAGAIEADTVIATADNSDTLNYIAFFNNATGAQAMKTDTGLSYNASTNALTTGTFIGNVTGNASGTAATVTTAAQPAITSVGTLSSLAVSGNITANAFTGTLAGNGASITSIGGNNITTGTIAAARVATLNQSTSGNAATATRLQTARTIGGVSFNGTAAINLPGVNVAGNQSTSGTAATVTTAAQPAITSLGTLNNLQVDQVNINANVISYGSGGIYLRGTSVVLQSPAGNPMFHGAQNAAVNIYYNGASKLVTQAGGVYIYGTLTASGNITAYSDRRLKTNIELIPNSIDKIKKINGYTFNRTDMEGKHTGVIAQEVEKVLPEVIVENEDGMKSVAYGNMVGLLIEAIKDQQKQIDNLTILCDELKKG